MLITLFLLLIGCPDDTFECSGKAPTTVPADAVCDGVVDCWQGQDESDEDCPTELFYCDQIEAQAILAEQVCDGVDDCGVGADEVDCELDSR